MVDETEDQKLSEGGGEPVELPSPNLIARKELDELQEWSRRAADASQKPTKRFGPSESRY